uniref:Uncharacterized protein n=2 Tax=Anguilla anguilla TaxID=7936 RepID=A0A0E9R8X0_ANGAN
MCMCVHVCVCAFHYLLNLVNPIIFSQRHSDIMTVSVNEVPLNSSPTLKVILHNMKATYTRQGLKLSTCYVQLKVHFEKFTS